MHYVIIGNSAAAVGCIEGIRSQDPAGKITVISQEHYHTYSRPLISYLLLGKTDEERMKYRGPSFYQDNGCDVKLGVCAEKINVPNKEIILSTGEKICYDSLLIATGSSPFIPKIDGLDRVEKKFTFQSLDDAKALAKALTPSSRVLILGAGLIGLKCAEAITARAAQITVVDLADHILPSILDETGAGIVRTHLEEHGIRFRLAQSVTRFEPGRARLTNGDTIDFDVLVLAVGVRPNVRLAEQAGIALKRGILTDARCQVNIPYIYAAGDCTESIDITTATAKIMALLPNAYLQGECAGINMAGGEKRYDKAIPMNAIGFFGLHLISAGTYEGKAYQNTDGKNYRKLVTRDHLLKGYVLIGNVERAGIYTALIREQKPLKEIDFELIREKPQLMAFSKKERSAYFSGVR